MQTSPPTATAHSYQTVRRAIRYFHDDLGLIEVLILCIAISFSLSLIQPWIFPAMLIDLFTTPPSTPPRTDWVYRTLLSILPKSPQGQILGLGVLYMLTQFGLHTTWFIGRVMLNKRIKYNGLARVRLALYEKYQHLALDYHRNRPQGDSIYRLSNDTQGFFNILDTLIGAAVACVTVIVVIVIMFLNSVPLTLLALCVLPPLVITNIYFARVIRRRALIAKQAESDFTTTIQQSIASIGLIQLFYRLLPDFLRVKKAVVHANETNWSLNWFDESLYPLSMQLIFAAGAMLIFGVGGTIAYRDQFVLHEPNGVTFGKLVVFIAYLNQLNDPLSRITGFKAAIQTNVAAADRVLVILDTPVTITDHPEAQPLPLAPRTLHLQNISFSYPKVAPLTPIPLSEFRIQNSELSQAPVLSNIHATIPPGTFAAFVGASGAGKTTLFSLLPRFYDPTTGAIRLDNHDIRIIPLADLRKHIAMVQQDCPLFPATVADNIAFANPDAPREEIIAAAKQAGAHEFISKLPHGYDTEISESANVSGGQRQRLALARALLAHAPILLLDEPTSAQDPTHAAAILDTISNLRGKRTILLITHDLSLVPTADQLFILHNGQITAAGPPSEILHQHLTPRPSHHPV